MEPASTGRARAAIDCGNLARRPSPYVRKEALIRIAGKSRRSDQDVE
jgi:hypothetical protein